MNPVLFHLFGPLSIHTYGVCIALGVLVALILATHNSLVKNNSLLEKHLLSLVNITIIAGIIGGRLLYVLSEPNQFTSWLDIFAIWDGGFSVLGSILCALIALSVSMKMLKLPILLALDVFGIYAPLVQAFGRVGCFFAGCCHGTPAHHFLSVTYTNTSSAAPLCVALHPTQLYNTAALFLIFMGLHWYAQSKNRHHGEIILLSLFGLSLVRFATDFWRGDRGLLWETAFGNFSLYQLLCLGFMIPALIFLFAIRFSQHLRSE